MGKEPPATNPNRSGSVLRYLRIAVSVLSLTAFVLLVAFWFRSCHQVDNLYLRTWGGRTLNFSSGLGQLAINLQPAGSGEWPHPRNWHFMTQPAAPIRESLAKQGYAPPTLKFRRTPVNSILFMRFWIPVLTTGLLAALLGIRRPYRFSLRTLLIAMTLIAVLLGLVVASI